MTAFFKPFSKLEKTILFIIFILYFHNLFIDIMQVDAAQYASISAQMSFTNSYLQVKEFIYDYLDKPPLLFWLSSSSFKLFGLSNFAYKLPAFLFLIFSLYGLYRFALLYYTPKIARNSLLILASTQSYFLMTNDVRTDGLLTSSVIISVCFFSYYFEKGNWKNLVLGSVFTALAMMSKGPIGLVTVLLPIGIHLLYHKKWKHIFSLNWLLVFFIIAILLVPMSYGLYTQFDLHPEKITNGVKGQKGLYFFYWLQSFGRITGENVWNNNQPWYFFINSSLWDFFPWFLPLLFALFYKIKSLFKPNKEIVEIISISGFVLVFILLSLSKYKLPHYVFVTFPFAAILVSEYFSKISEKIWRNWRILHLVLAVIILILFIIYPLFFFTEINYLVFICIALQAYILYQYYKSKENSVAQLVSLIVMLNVFFSFVFYPKLLEFQSDSVAAKYVINSDVKEEVYLFEKHSHSFSFYIKNPFVKVIQKEQIQKIKKSFWIYLSQDELKELADLKLNITKKVSFADYPITRLKMNFLLSDKRNNAVTTKFLIQVKN